MWNIIVERIPNTMGLVCTILAFLIPYVTYKVNQKLHKEMDPPWKKEEQTNQQSRKQPSN